MTKEEYHQKVVEHFILRGICEADAKESADATMEQYEEFIADDVMPEEAVDYEIECWEGSL